MPYLADYVGHLLSEITLARVQADLEAIRIAELYAGHTLLRHLPVPHFRLPTVTLEVPVVIDKMEESVAGESPRGGIVLPAMRKSFERLLDIHLKRAAIEFVSNERALLKQALGQTIADAAQPADVSISVTSLADDLVSAVTDVLRDPEREGGAVEATRLEKFADQLRSAARVEFLNLRNAPPRLHVLVTTAELRKAAPSELLARLHLSVSEEAFEWIVIESTGKSTSRLVPE
jgi:hypothetical protein